MEVATTDVFAAKMPGQTVGGKGQTRSPRDIRADDTRGDTVPYGDEGTIDLALLVEVSPGVRLGHLVAEEESRLGTWRETVEPRLAFGEEVERGGKSDGDREQDGLEG